MKNTTYSEDNTQEINELQDDLEKKLTSDDLNVLETSFNNLSVKYTNLLKEKNEKSTSSQNNTEKN